MLLKNWCGYQRMDPLGFQNLESIRMIGIPLRVQIRNYNAFMPVKKDPPVIKQLNIQSLQICNLWFHSFCTPFIQIIHCFFIDPKQIGTLSSQKSSNFFQNFIHYQINFCCTVKLLHTIQNHNLCIQGIS